jgi:hypothetical protein
VLQFFSMTELLTTWLSGNGEQTLQVVRKRLTTSSYRPSTRGERVHPSALREYRKTHRFLGPNCLCPLLEEGEPDFVESAIYMPTSGPWAGFYVASCARERCAYLGGYFIIQSPIKQCLTYITLTVVLESLYPALGLPIRSYTKRGKS